MEQDRKQGFEVTSLKKYVIKECVRWVETKNNYKRDNNSGVPHVTAFAGHTGVGKTTLVNCLNRYLDIEAGHVFLDDDDITIGNNSCNIIGSCNGNIDCFFSTIK